MRPPVWQLIRDAAQELGAEMTYSAIKQHIWARYPDVNSATLTCQIIVCSVNHPSRLHYPENKKPRLCTTQYDFLYNTGRGKVVLYDPEKHGQWEIAERPPEGLIVRLVQEATVESPHMSEAEEESGGAFALESHLRDYLARNLPVLEGHSSALNLYVSEDGRDGVEFQTDVGPIDILTTAKNGDFYIFELKLGRGPDAALGQILRYMGWVNEHLANGKEVFGIVIAAEISKKLKYAATQVPKIRLMEYKLRVSLTPVPTLTSSVAN